MSSYFIFFPLGCFLTMSDLLSKKYVKVEEKWILLISGISRSLNRHTHACIVLLFYQWKCILFAALKYFMSLFYYSYLSFTIYTHFKCILFIQWNKYAKTLYQNSERNAKNPWKAELNWFLLNYLCSVLNSLPFFSSPNFHRMFS